MWCLIAESTCGELGVDIYLSTVYNAMHRRFQKNELQYDLYLLPLSFGVMWIGGRFAQKKQLLTIQSWIC